MACILVPTNGSDGANRAIDPIATVGDRLLGEEVRQLGPCPVVVVP